jgi:hypothetical protein
MVYCDLIIFEFENQAIISTISKRTANDMTDQD